MRDINQFIHDLSSEEIRAIRIAFKSSAAKKEFLLEKLFNILSSPVQSLLEDQEISVLLYREKKLRALAALKSRLLYYMLDVLSSDRLIAKDSFLDIADSRAIRLRKRMVQCRILLRKKSGANVSIIKNITDEVIQDSIKQEQYDIAVDALTLKKYLSWLRTGHEGVNKLEDKINYYQIAHHGVIRSADYYYKLVVNQTLLSERHQRSIKDLLSEATTEIKKFLAHIESAVIKQYFLLIKLELKVQKSDFEGAVLQCQELLRLLKVHKNVTRTERIGSAYINLSHFQTCTRNFSEALESIRSAQKFYAPKSLNHLVCTEAEFYICFYSNNYKKALATLKSMLIAPTSLTGDFRHHKFIFMKACTLFKLGETKQALKLSDNILEISKDKGRWDTGLRYLRIMCFVELNDERAEGAIEALRKSQERNTKNKLASPRDLLILKALQLYALKAFSEVRDSKLNKILAQLSAPKGELSWKMFTHELICVHKWLLERTR